MGPTPYLWLDYSQVTGTLNQIRVARPGGEANVCLAWEHWRVLVVATRKIIPFEPLIRAASSEEQFALHQSLDYARRGFLIVVILFCRKLCIYCTIYIETCRYFRL
jgi:hypothetical protein